eukprot:CAMPEP_0197040178 /NCGR_PEP_ID=MMETSP1384-20130603/16924_1 /TAXON_ID=29189 /ORGANISM="Ammonia sp." /LENGTH=151 /DNA_ID=CAMNT_0042470891 /DNA_START=16 /DNA_END=468 /DNA_ORIENTATION=+
MTSSGKFYSSGLREEEVADIHLMHQKGYFLYHNDDNYQYLKFPFTDSNDLFVLFALPINEELYDDKNGLLTDINVMKAAIDNLKSTYIALALPKISVEASYTLNSPLMDLGMVDAFGFDGNFSGIGEGGGLKIDVVIHKTMVEMDEKGLVA